MSVERVIYCEGPDCTVHVRTTSPRRIPTGFLEVVEGDPDGPVTHDFCGWECAMKFAAAIPPPEIIELSA